MVVAAVGPVAAQEASPADSAPLTQSLQKALRDREFERISELLKQGAVLPGVELYETFFQAAQKGDSGIFFTLADHYRRFSDHDGELLSNAVESGNLLIAREILQRYYDSETMRWRARYAPLVRAAELNDLQMVRLLLEGGLDPTMRTGMGKSAFLYAVENDNLEMLRLMVAHGYDMNSQEWDLREQMFCAAARNGNAGIVKFMLENGGQVIKDVRYLPSETGLGVAAEYGHTDIVKMIVESGIHPDEAEWKKKDTPLIKALANGHYDTAEYLIGQGAGIEGEYYDSPLVAACRTGEMPLVNLVLGHLPRDREFDNRVQYGIRAASRNGHVPVVGKLLELIDGNINYAEMLSSAASFGQVSSVIYWLDRGADIDAVHYGRNALYNAASAGHNDVVLLLCERGAQVDFASPYPYPTGLTPLMIAAINGHREVVQTLISYGADVNRCDARLETPLMMAAGQPDTGLMEFLLRHGADIHAVDYKGDNVLMFAARYTNCPGIEYLVGLGLDVNHRNKYGRTPLMAAILEKYDEMNGTIEFDILEERSFQACRLLLEYGADVNASDFEGITPYLIAVDHGYAKTAELLLGNHADPAARNIYGEDARALYNEFYGETLTGGRLKELLGIGEEQLPPREYRYPVWDRYERICAAVRENDIEGIAAALREGSTLHVEDAGDLEAPPVMYVAMQAGAAVPTLVFLVENGAWVNTVNANGTSPLMRAVMAGDREAVEFFLAKGAEINAANSYGNRALSFAAKSGDGEMIKILVKNGAAVDFRNENGKSPLDIARENGQEEVARLLVSLGAK